ncbi:hypothetical protein ACFQVC_27800 [Streptomyces monticola]|uniref:Uncharacterized protein n=1 Tax=Streptomyces monticola TaxID=2666263 RepID=A0ABW2JPC4_9ACTN
MSTAQHLRAIDLLCSRDLRAEHRGSHLRGPGFELTELLRTTFDDGGMGEYDTVAEQYEAERDALLAPLGAKWGETHEIGLQGWQLRGGLGDEIPEPWHRLSGLAESLHVWRAGDRWLALGITYHDGPALLRLVAAATDIDPP